MRTAVQLAEERERLLHRRPWKPLDTHPRHTGLKRCSKIMQKSAKFANFRLLQNGNWRKIIIFESRSWQEMWLFAMLPCGIMSERVERVKFNWTSHSKIRKIRKISTLKEWEFRKFIIFESTKSWQEMVLYAILSSRITSERVERVKFNWTSHSKIRQIRKKITLKEREFLRNLSFLRVKVGKKCDFLQCFLVELWVSGLNEWGLIEQVIIKFATFAKVAKFLLLKSGNLEKSFFRVKVGKKCDFLQSYPVELRVSELNEWGLIERVTF